MAGNSVRLHRVQMETTVGLREVFCGTEMSVLQEGIPGVIPVEGCYLGWQESIGLLALLVEADVQRRNSRRSPSPL